MKRSTALGETWRANMMSPPRTDVKSVIAPMRILLLGSIRQNAPRMSDRGAFWAYGLRVERGAVLRGGVRGLQLLVDGRDHVLVLAGHNHVIGGGFRDGERGHVLVGLARLG